MANKSIDKLRNLIKDTLSKRKESENSIYKVTFKKYGNKKEEMSVFQYGEKFFEYDITDNKIISFNRINQYSKSTLNEICNILKLSGEFINKYKRIGYELVYSKDNKFYDEKMNRIHSNLEKEFKEHISRINKERYNKIRKIMSYGKIQLYEIPGHKTWLKKINDKWYIFSDLEKDAVFPISAKEVFNTISSGLCTFLLDSKNSKYKTTLKTNVYKNRYIDYISKKIDSGELKKWKIEIKNYSRYKFKLTKFKKDQWLLDSEGEITFDERTMNSSHVKDFIRYVLSIGPMNYFPDIIKNTPINLLIDENRKFDKKTSEIIKIVGKEIRINYRNIKKDNDIHKELVATSIYGKQCTIFEFDIGILIRDGFFYKIFQRFEDKITLEKTVERIKLIKVILPEFKFPIILDENDKKLIICNRDGEFHISMIDATLTKRVGKLDLYICVGPRDTKSIPYVIYKGIKYEIDPILDEVLSKLIMLINEEYPDITTKMQIKYDR